MASRDHPTVGSFATTDVITRPSVWVARARNFAVAVEREKSRPRPRAALTSLFKCSRCLFLFIGCAVVLYIVIALMLLPTITAAAAFPAVQLKFQGFTAPLMGRYSRKNMSLTVTSCYHFKCKSRSTNTHIHINTRTCIHIIHHTYLFAFVNYIRMIPLILKVIDFWLKFALHWCVSVCHCWSSFFSLGKEREYFYFYLQS